MSSWQAYTECCSFAISIFLLFAGRLSLLVPWLCITGSFVYEDISSEICSRHTLARVQQVILTVSLFFVFVLCCCLVALFFSRFGLFIINFLILLVFFFIYYFLEFHKLQLIVFIWNLSAIFSQVVLFRVVFLFLSCRRLSIVLISIFQTHLSSVSLSLLFSCIIPIFIRAFMAKIFIINKIQCTKSVYLEMYIESWVDKYLLNGLFWVVVALPMQTINKNIAIIDCYSTFTY